MELPSNNKSGGSSREPSRVAKTRTITLHVAAYLAVFLLAVLVAVQVFPQQFGEEAVRPFGFSWPSRLRSVDKLLGDTHIRHGSPEENLDNQDAASAEWKFDYRRDANNHGLSEEQCTAAFPLLTKEIDRAVEYRHKVGNITLKDLDIAWREHGIVRVQIRDNQLYIIDTLKVERGHRTRYLATLNDINAALVSYQGKLPNVEFTFCVQDSALRGNANQKRVVLGYTRLEHQESMWLMPDFGFWGWPKVGMPSYQELRTVLDDSEGTFLEKIPKLVWRGSVGWGAEVRHALIDHSENESWSDVHAIKWGNEENKAKYLISMEDHCDYMFTAMTEGSTWSGRLKLLLNCHSVVVSHKLDWIEFYHHLLSDKGDSQNYVLLDRKFDKLNETMHRLLDPDTLQTETRRIADNARTTFREQYLTPAAISCYWRALFRGWASVQGFEPEMWAEPESNPAHTGKVRRRPRGVSFESYTIMEALEWEVPAQPRILVMNDKVYYK